MNTKNYSLLLMLKNFQGATEKQDENEKLTTLALQFMNMAEKIRVMIPEEEVDAHQENLSS